jgi:hypothetical protein
MLSYRKSFPEYGSRTEEFQSALVLPQKLICAESYVPEHKSNRRLHGSFDAQSRILSNLIEETKLPTVGAKNALGEPGGHLCSFCTEAFRTRSAL